MWKAAGHLREARWRGPWRCVSCWASPLVSTLPLPSPLPLHSPLPLPFASYFPVLPLSLSLPSAAVFEAAGSR